MISPQELEDTLRAGLGAADEPIATADGGVLRYVPGSVEEHASGALLAVLQSFIFAGGQILDIKEQQIVVVPADARAARARLAAAIACAQRRAAAGDVTLMPHDLFPAAGPAEWTAWREAPQALTELPAWAPRDPDACGDEVHELVRLADRPAILCRDLSSLDVDAAAAAGFGVLLLTDQDGAERFLVDEGEEDDDAAAVTQEILAHAGRLYADLVAEPPAPPRVPDLAAALMPLATGAPTTLAAVRAALAAAPGHGVAAPPAFAEDERGADGDGPGEDGDDQAVPADDAEPRDLFANADTPGAALLLQAASIEEALAACRFGHFNDCPETAFHLALLRKWRERYGARLTCVAKDLLNFELTTPPATPQALKDAARDIALMGADEHPEPGDFAWRFWWD